MYKRIYSSVKYISLIAMLLTAVVISAIMYTIFSNHIKNDLKNEAEMILSIVDKRDVFNSVISKSDCEIIITDIDGGNVIYNNIKTDKINTLFTYTTVYDKYRIQISLQTMECTLLIAACGVIAFILIMIFGVLIYVSRAVADAILKPIQNIYSFDKEKREYIYEELKPFIQRIYGQSQEIERQMGKVRQQKLRLNTITGNMSEGLVVLDENARILSLNQSVVKLFDVEDTEVKYKDFSYISSDEELKEGIEKALDGKKNNIIKNIGDKTYRVYFSPAVENNLVSGAVLLLLDVTELIRTEEIRKEFSANVSHELKTPLTTIHGYAQIIKHGMAKPEMLETFIGKIEKETSRLITLIEDIIKLSNLDENKQDYEKEWILLEAVVTKVAEQLQPQADARNITIEIIGRGGRVYANESGINEIIYNLCDNAVKYNKDGGRVEMIMENDTVMVKDTGIGIPEEYQDRIFERFFRVDKSHSKKVNGTGLGLSIVKHLAKNNNCDVSVKSTPDVGTVFTIRFFNYDNNRL